MFQQNGRKSARKKVNEKIDLLSNKKSKNTSYIPRLKSRQEKEKQKLTELKEKMLESQEILR